MHPLQYRWRKVLQTFLDRTLTIPCSQGTHVLCNCRGTVIGILKALLGLSASVYTTIYFAFFEPHSIRFLLVLAIGPSAIALTFMIFLNHVPYIQVEPHTKVDALHTPFV